MSHDPRAPQTDDEPRDDAEASTDAADLATHEPEAAGPAREDAPDAGPTDDAEPEGTDPSAPDGEPALDDAAAAGQDLGDAVTTSEAAADTQDAPGPQDPLGTDDEDEAALAGDDPASVDLGDDLLAPAPAPDVDDEAPVLDPADLPGAGPEDVAASAAGHIETSPPATDRHDVVDEDLPGADDPTDGSDPRDSVDLRDGAAAGTASGGAPSAAPDAAAEPPATTGAIGAVGRHGTPTQPEPRGLRGLGRALRPRASRSQVMVAVLCALLGFALVVQVTQTQEDQLSSLRQSDLVRLLDDVTQRSGELENQVSSLQATRDELQSGSGRERAALELAEQQAQTLGILSGRLPAEGPGVQIEVVEGAEPLDAFALFNVLEELRNAGAEAMEVNGVRLVASSYFEDSADGIVVDGQVIDSPYRWTVIGDPSTLETALEIPGGAMASLRADGARTTITQQDRVEVTATVEPGAPQFATPVPADE